MPTKKTKRTKKNLGGRPTVMTDAIVEKLEEAFSWGCTDEEACLYAGIHRTTLYNYIEIEPEFFDRKEELKKEVSLYAKRNIANAVKKKRVAYLSQWHLERKDDEYKGKQIVENINKNVNVDIPLTKTEEEQMKKALNLIGINDGTGKRNDGKVVKPKINKTKTL